MSKINIRKRGNYYEYRVEIAPVDGKRQWLSKSGYRTKPEAQEAGVQAYNEYLIEIQPQSVRQVVLDYCLVACSYGSVMHEVQLF